MKIGRHILAFWLLSMVCAYAQNMVILTAPKDPEVKPEQRTATIVHYEKMRVTARGVIRMLAMAMQNTDGSSTTKLNQAINDEQDAVDWANWCILALRDKTADAKACVFQPESR